MYTCGIQRPRWWVSARGLLLLLVVIVVLYSPLPAHAHSGAPYPLLLDEPVGPYRLTVWTDPDVGQGTFIITGKFADGTSFHPSTTVTLTAEPLDGHASAQTFSAKVTQGRDGKEFRVVVPFDQEGKWNVVISVQGEKGTVQVERVVDVTAQGNSLWSILLWSAPFLGLALLWAYAVLRSRRKGNNAIRPSSPGANST